MVRTGKRGVRKEDLRFLYKLRTRFVILGLVVVAMVTIVVLAVLREDYRDIIDQSAKTSIERLSRSIFQTLFAVMSAGGSSQQVLKTLELAKNERYVDKLELFVSPSAAIDSPRSSLASFPEEIREAIATGVDRDIIFKDYDRKIRHLKPFKADETCITCHINAKAGSVLGVMDLTFSLAEYDKTSSASIEYIALVIFALTFSASLFFFAFSTKLIFAPIAELENATERLAKNAGDPDVRLGEWGKNEFGVIADHFNRFIEAVYEINRKLEREEAKMKRFLEEREEEIKRRTAQVHELNRELNHYLDIVDENVITSRTDTQGVITYVSAAFCRVSGFTKEELLGQPHNIVRHPDTPRELFADLWGTIKQDLTWSGELKNRKKDGGFFWVQTTVLPIFSETSVVKGYMAIRHDITLQKELAETLQKLNEATKQSHTDALTGIMNRLRINELLQMEIDRLERYDESLSVALLDIDHFKAVNDTYGHLVGDQTLKTLSNILVAKTRKTDLAARWGGEEFLVVLINTSEEWAARKMEQLRLAVETHEYGDAPKITVSVGVSSYKRGDTMETLIGRADVALYLAKAGGRNRVEVASNDKSKTIKADLAGESKSNDRS
ncbi:MAG: diguanylate cyclase [Helicobacteraceae bacterium]|jgi:diguanylate cyclase (GGDEF)-like protein/PAS domain S-box-containing protein|nr:diguanylate cyclase [Helicobacteraceae bacterium]